MPYVANIEMVKLSNSHIIIDKETAAALFSDAAQVNWVYYPQRKTLMVAAGADTLFKSLHKTSGSLLKIRNEQGDRSISMLELIIDNDLDGSDRELSFKADTEMKILSIYF